MKREESYRANSPKHRVFRHKKCRPAKRAALEIGTCYRRSVDRGTNVETWAIEPGNLLGF
jgi:hypothetical protein